MGDREKPKIRGGRAGSGPLSMGCLLIGEGKALLGEEKHTVTFILAGRAIIGLVAVTVGRPGRHAARAHATWPPWLGDLTRLLKPSFCRGYASED